MPALCETVKLGWIVGEQHDPRAIQHLEHTCGDAVIALIVVEAERGIGVEGVEAVVLQLICPHLVGETKPAPFLRQIQNDAAAEVFEPRQSEPNWSPQSQRREPNTSPVRQAECSRTGTASAKSGFPTMMATGLPPIASRNTTKRVGVPELSGTEGFACHDERANCIIGETGHRICLNPDDVLLARHGAACHIRRQHRRQSMRYLDELNGSGGGPARRPGRRNAIGGQRR